MNFKVGDRIQIIKTGKIVTLEERFYSNNGWFAKDNNGHLWVVMDNENFELVKSYTAKDIDYMFGGSIGPQLGEQVLRAEDQRKLFDAAIKNTNPAYIQETSCSHSWVEYVGFSLAYEFCGKCDKKRNVKKA